MVKNTNRYYQKRSDLTPTRSVAELIAAGFKPQQALAPEQPATAMRFAGAAGDEHWIGLNNFYVITRYNHSALYAMAVYQLSQESWAYLNNDDHTKLR